MAERAEQLAVTAQGLLALVARLGASETADDAEHRSVARRPDAAEPAGHRRAA
jgi:hypothetical protein